MNSTSPSDNPMQNSIHLARLSLWDVVNLIIGIVVGVSIFKVPGLVMEMSGTPSLGLAMWVLGGVLALSGALCYAELAATYPRFGAEYVYLHEAFGFRVAFLFGWLQTFAILPTSMGAMAFVFADYATSIDAGLLKYQGLIAVGSILLLTTLQMFGFQVGRISQNILTTLKVISVSALILCGLFFSGATEAFTPGASETARGAPSLSSMGLALVFVLYAYGGWSDVTCLTPEVRDCRKTVPRALILGLLLICGLYLLLNFAYLRTLGYEGLVNAKAPAAELIRGTLGDRFSFGMSLIVMTSALGAMNGMVFAGCRLLNAVGTDVPMFRKWSIWTVSGAPIWGLLTLSVISVALTSLVATTPGQQLLEKSFEIIHYPRPDWEKFGGGFELLVAASAPIFWVFFALSGVALIVLRIRSPQQERPFQAPLYPFTPIVFTMTAAYMFWSSVQYAGNVTVIMTPIFLLGLLVSLFCKAPKPDSQIPSNQ
ncbi:APC family permease [Planctomicrobium sp. SH668]|uniref:APC family permease n=1 Tax=Planctomicrobium sp. SH668 TaxID=3448126 RepID=UPI003F5C20EC